MNAIDERIKDIAESGQRSAITKQYELLTDVLNAVSLHYAIPVGELLNVVKDELGRDGR